MNLTTQRPSAASELSRARARPLHPGAAFFPAPPTPGTETPTAEDLAPIIHQSIYPPTHPTPPSSIIHQALPPPNRPITDWINEIRKAWAVGASNTLALARLVSSARESLRHRRQWSRLWHDGLLKVPFCKKKADRLAKVGLELGELSETKFTQMPSAWTTLYYLAQLGRRKVEQLIAEGRIHPDLTLQGAKDLLAEFRPGRKRSRPGPLLRLRLARFSAYIQTAAPICSAADRRFARAELLKLAEIFTAPPPRVAKAPIAPAPFKHLETEPYPCL